MNIVISLGLFFCSLSAFASDQIFRYILNDFPGPVTECEKYAVTFAEKLADSAAVKIYTATCQPQAVENAFTITVHYSAKKEISDSFIIRESLEEGYGTHELCRQDLANQVEMFRASTTLEPIAQYCSNKGALQIHAIGSSEVKRHNFSIAFGDLTITDPFIENPAQVQEEIREVLSLRGMKVSRSTVVSNKESSARLNLFYYAKKPAAIMFVRQPTYLNMQQCLVEKESMDRFIIDFDNAHLFSFCAENKSSRGYSATYYALTLPKFRVHRSIDVYSDETECKNDFSRVIDFYRQNLGRSVRPVCTLSRYSPFEYSMLLFEAN